MRAALLDSGKKACVGAAFWTSLATAAGRPRGTGAGRGKKRYMGEGSSDCDGAVELRGEGVRGSGVLDFASDGGWAAAWRWCGSWDEAIRGGGQQRLCRRSWTRGRRRA